MILDGNGLTLDQVEPILASMLGDDPQSPGGVLLAEAVIHDRSKVNLRDLLYCLAKSPGSWIRKRLIDLPGKSPDEFIEIFEESLDQIEDSGGLPPMRLTSATVSPLLFETLERAAKIAEEHGHAAIADPALTLALLEKADDDLRDLLLTWAGEDGLVKLERLLLAALKQVDGVSVFRSNGKFARYALRVESGQASGGDDSDSMPSTILVTRNGEELQLRVFDADGEPIENCKEKSLPAPAEEISQLKRDLENLWEAGSIPAEQQAGIIDSVSAVLGHTELNPDVWSPSGKAFCKRLVGDAASLGVKKITTRHVLYSLLSNDSGLLPVALSIRGVSVKADMHAPLSRELSKRGRKRNDNLKLDRRSIFPAVEAFFKESYKIAVQLGDNTIGEGDLGRAFVLKYHQEMTRFFSADKPLDLQALRDYVETVDPEDDAESQAPLQRYSIEEIERNINNKVFGQERAVAQVVPWIKRLRFGFPRDGKPAAVVLFLGPTGTGKTQLAKELARYVYGSEDAMLFMEMGQFQSKESMNMFIGAPPGYIGYGEGKLTNGLAEKPECVVLFDEIEKAHIEVFDTLLRFADEGIISDPAGPERDGRKCIIVMTTNAGQAWLRDYIKENPDARTDEDLPERLLEAATEEMAKKGFRPEFIGRVDARISFMPFTLSTCRKIVGAVLDSELRKFQDLKNVFIEVPDDVRNIMAQEAFEKSMNEGARGAPRAVNEYIVSQAIDILTRDEGITDPSHRTNLIASKQGLSDIIIERVQ